MDLFDIIYLDPIFEILQEIEYGSLILTCKKSLLIMRQKIGLDNTMAYINLYQSLFENNYDSIDGDEKILNIMKKIMADKMDQFCFHNIMLYENILPVLQRYQNLCTRDIITLLEYYKKINSHEKNNSIVDDKIEIVENYFCGNTNFDRSSMTEIPRYGDSIDYVTVRIILPDLASNEKTKHYKYKNQWPLHFFKGSKLEIGGSAFYYYNFSKNDGTFHGIVNNVMYWTFNLADIFGKNITRPSISSEIYINLWKSTCVDHWKHIRLSKNICKCMRDAYIYNIFTRLFYAEHRKFCFAKRSKIYENACIFIYFSERNLSDAIVDNYSYETDAITGFPLIHNRFYNIWLYIKFGSIIDLIDTNDTNDLQNDLKLEMVDASLFCRYYFNNGKNKTINNEYRYVYQKTSLTYVQNVTRNHLWNVESPITGKMIHLMIESVTAFKILSICLQIDNEFFLNYDFVQEKCKTNNDELWLDLSLPIIPLNANVWAIIEYQSLIFSCSADMSYCNLSVCQIPSLI